MSPTSSFLRPGLEAWRESWNREAYILHAARVPANLPETDVFAGLD